MRPNFRSSRTRSRNRRQAFRSCSVHWSIFPFDCLQKPQWRMSIPQQISIWRTAHDVRMQGHSPWCKKARSGIVDAAASSSVYSEELEEDTLPLLYAQICLTSQQLSSKQWGGMEMLQHHTSVRCKGSLISTRQHLDKCRPRSRLQAAWHEAELRQPRKFCHRKNQQRDQQRFVSMLNPGDVKIQPTSEKADILTP